MTTLGGILRDCRRSGRTCGMICTQMEFPVTATPIAIVGNVNLDIKTSLIPAGDGILADGETSVAEIFETLGGGGANTAVAAAHMGGTVHFFACVGSDSLGDRIEAALNGYGIVTRLARKPTATGRSINLNWSNGSRHFVSSLPNNRSMTVEDIDIERLIAAGCRTMLRSDVWFSESMLAGGNRALLSRVREAGIETYIDINWDPEWSLPGNGELVGKRRAQLTEVLPFICCAHGNERELGYFTGCEDVLDACRFLTGHGVREVIVHRGARGAASYSGAGGWVEVPAAPAGRVVSPTGCGDVFCAAHMLFAELPVVERLRAAARVAAEHLSAGRTLIPRLDGLERGLEWRP
jgi:ribokinase